MSFLADHPGPPIAAVAPTLREPAWLERVDGSRQPLGKTCSLGRSVENDLSIADDQVSRRHAVIQLQGRREYFVSDLGSINGSFLNDLRLTRRVRLFHGDHLVLGNTRFRFQQPGGPVRPRPVSARTSETLRGERPQLGWLLVAGMEGSTLQARRLGPARLPLLLQQWFEGCRQLIESAGGSLNKYLGDGFLAHWRDRADTVAPLAEVLRELQRRQSHRSPNFRVVLHFGEVTIGNVDRMGAENLAGAAVNFALRMDKLAEDLGRPTLLSSSARVKLGDHLAVTDAGVHEVNLFPGPFPFYALA